MTELNVQDIKFRKLRARISEIYGSQTAFADATGRDRATVSKLLNGIKEFDPADIESWARDLAIPGPMYHAYFFNKESRDITTLEEA